MSYSQFLADRMRQRTIDRLQCQIEALQAAERADQTAPSMLTVRLDRGEHLQAKAAARAIGLSLNQFCVAAITGFATDVLAENQSPAPQACDPKALAAGQGSFERGAANAD